MNWGPVILDEEEFAEFEHVMMLPYAPNPMMEKAAKLLRDLYHPQDNPRICDACRRGGVCGCVLSGPQIT